MDPFVHIHCHSTYSFLDGYGSPDQYVSRAVELGQTAVAVTDHGNVSAHKKWNDACLKAGIKPILGVEAYVCEDAAKKDAAHKKLWHITLLAKNAEGYRNLLKLVTVSWCDGFYYKPRIDWEMLRQYSKGLVATSGCPSGRIGDGVAREGWTTTEVVKELKRQAALFEDYYVEMSPWQYEEGKSIAQAVYKSARKEGMRPVLSMDAHYPRTEDAFIQDVMLCINNNCRHSDQGRMKFSQDDYCLHSGDDMAAKWRSIHGKSLPLLDDMMLNTRRIADSVNLDFPNATPLSYGAKDKNKLLREWCERGLKAKGVADRKDYRERLEYEYGLVIAKDFADYFLVVADLVCWAKDNGVLVGPARGSSCGSLMCYLLRITSIDPMVHGLMFERFIDITRKDLPDIDLDFESDRRHEVKQYIEDKYGADRVATLATFSTYKGKICLQDIGRVFADKIPIEAVEECKRLVIERSSADSRHGATIEDTFTNFDQAGAHLKKYPELGLAKQLEGQIRQLGVHAAGLVISNDPIGNFAAVYVTKNKDRVISMDYPDASSVGLLKIDVLGLTALSAMKRTLVMIEKNHGKKILLDELDLNDQEVYQAFCDKRLQGIFQFIGESTRQVCRQVQPKNFQDLVAINALSRPGPLHSGNTTSFIERRHGREPKVSLHPLIDHVIDRTNGMIVFQEQVMQIVRIMGRFDWSGIATVRKMMSKKYGDEAFGKMKERFVEGATSQGVTIEKASEVWANICTHGAWSFNESHSVAYSVLAYQLMWLKVHYPSEFYAGIISCENDVEKQRRMFKEYTNSGRKLSPVCVNSSQDTVACDSSGLRLGLDSVVGLSEKAIGEILVKRPFKSYPDFTKRCKISKGQADKLLRIGAFRNIEFDSLTEQQDLFGAHKATTDTFDYRNPKEADIRAFCPLAAEGKTFAKWREWLAKKSPVKLWLAKDLDDVSERTELVLLGSANPSTGFNAKNKMEESASRGIEWTPREGEEDLTKDQYNFLNFDFEDETDSVIVRLSYKLYPKYKEWIWNIKPDDVLGVRGMMNGTMRMVFATDVVNLTEMGKRIRAKQPLTPQEKEFFQAKKIKFNNRHHQKKVYA